METKINVAAIMKNKPQGTKLYDWLHNLEVELDEVATTEIETVVWCTKKDEDYNVLFGYSRLGTLRGWFDGLQILFPSKEMRDWSKFQWEKGDVLISNDGGTEVIFDKWYDDTYTNFYSKHYLNSEDENNIKYYENFLCTTEKYSLEDKNTAQTYIKAVEERCGGKLNLETLKIEKKTKFEDGDIAFADYGNRQYVFIVSGETGLSEGYNSSIYLDLSSPTSSMEFRTSFFKKDLCELRLATEEEKEQLFSALEKESKAWDAENKMVVDLKPKWTPKPFDKVLVRDSKASKWRANLFSHKNIDEPYYCVYASWNYCIPYEGNEHLLGTTKNVGE